MAAPAGQNYAMNQGQYPPNYYPPQQTGYQPPPAGQYPPQPYYQVKPFYIVVFIIYAVTCRQRSNHNAESLQVKKH